MGCGKFEKVSKGIYTDALSAMPNVSAIYDGIKLPRRATKGSAGYDFFAPYAIRLAVGESITVPTGIRAKISDGWALFLFPRSGLGFKYRLQLDNSVGVVDGEYYSSENEGHIFVSLTNCGKAGRVVEIEAGAAFVQGVFMPFGKTDDDEVTATRKEGPNKYVSEVQKILSGSDILSKYKK